MYLQPTSSFYLQKPIYLSVRSLKRWRICHPSSVGWPKCRSRWCLLKVVHTTLSLNRSMAINSLHPCFQELAWSAAFSHVATPMLDPSDLVSSSDGDDESAPRKRAYGNASVEFACSYAWMHAYVKSSLPFLNPSYPSLQHHVEATFADAIRKGPFGRRILL